MIALADLVQKHHSYTLLPTLLHAGLRFYTRTITGTGSTRVFEMLSAAKGYNHRKLLLQHGLYPTTHEDALKLATCHPHLCAQFGYPLPQKYHEQYSHDVVLEMRWTPHRHRNFKCCSFRDAVTTIYTLMLRTEDDGNTVFSTELSKLPREIVWRILSHALNCWWYV